MPVKFGPTLAEIDQSWPNCSRIWRWRTQGRNEKLVNLQRHVFAVACPLCQTHLGGPFLQMRCVFSVGPDSNDGIQSTTDTVFSRQEPIGKLPSFTGPLTSPSTHAMHDADSSSKRCDPHARHDGADSLRPLLQGRPKKRDGGVVEGGCRANMSFLDVRLLTTFFRSLLCQH